jgi:diadenylate cyclase
MGYIGNSTTADLIVAIIVMVLIDLIAFSFLRRRWVMISTALFETLGIISYCCGMVYTLYLSFAAALVVIMAAFFSNSSDIRFIFANDLKGKDESKMVKAISGRGGVSQEDLDSAYSQVENAVITMSKQRMGAIMTFEKKDNLDSVISAGSGARINAQVSSEIIQGLFYPGGRLHDGAMIIRGNRIIAASVYFTPSKRNITAKCGSRHRAAYGISETTDSVTVLVSEETGKISIFFKGTAILVTPDNFLKVFQKCMNAA